MTIGKLQVLLLLCVLEDGMLTYTQIAIRANELREQIGIGCSCSVHVAFRGFFGNPLRNLLDDVCDLDGFIAKVYTAKGRTVYHRLTDKGREELERYKEELEPYRKALAVV